MKKIALLMLTLLALLITTTFYEAKAWTLYWFCAAAVKKPSMEIARKFNKTHKDKVVLIAGGTGQILQKMILSRKGDIYTCMDTTFFKQAQSKHIIIKYKPFLKLIPVFGLSKKGQRKIKNFSDLFKTGIKIAGGNPKTMALGKTYSIILKKLPPELSKRLKENTIVYAINISQIENYLKMSVVDAGIVFKSVAKINHFAFIPIPAKYNQIKTGYVAEMIFSRNRKSQEELYQFIIHNLDIYSKYGFTLLK